MTDRVLRIVPEDRALVDGALDAAREAKLQQVVILGWNPDGSIYLESSLEDGPPMLWLLEVAKAALLDAARDDG